MIRVTNHFGEPVANAFVRANPESPGWPPAFGRTDASGRAELQAGFGATRVDISHPELSDRWRDVVLDAGTTELHIRLEPAWETIESADGRRQRR